MSKRQDRRKARGIAALQKRYGGPKGLADALAKASANKDRERATRTVRFLKVERNTGPATRTVRFLKG